jgi:hypothetical protein
VTESKTRIPPATYRVRQSRRLCCLSRARGTRPSLFLRRSIASTPPSPRFQGTVTHDCFRAGDEPARSLRTTVAETG